VRWKKHNPAGVPDWYHYEPVYYKHGAMYPWRALSGVNLNTPKNMNIFFKNELYIRRLFSQYGGILHDYFSDNLSRVGSECKEKMDKSVKIISENTDKLLLLEERPSYRAYRDNFFKMLEKAEEKRVEESQYKMTDTEAVEYSRKIFSISEILCEYHYRGLVPRPSCDIIKMGIVTCKSTDFSSFERCIQETHDQGRNIKITIKHIK